MKRKTLFALLITLCGGVSAQTAIPNGNFENWDLESYEYPKHYATNSNKDALRNGFAYNLEKSTDAFHGSYAVKLSTLDNEGDFHFGYFVNSNPELEPSDWHGGIPYTEKPSGIRGYYKANVPAGDTALVLVAFSKNGVNIGTYAVPLYGQNSNYALFDHTFTPALSVTPDSVIFGATSSYVLAELAIEGSTLLLDSVSFTGVSSQPTLLNGDFEEWETENYETPAFWYEQGGDELPDLKTTDAFKGSFGVSLESTLVNWDGQPRAVNSSISTGYYPKNCNPCNQLGGHPFTNTSDTLVFWYKYTSAGGSKGSVSFMLRQGGNIIGGNQVDLEPADSFKKVEVPIQSFQTPDTLVVDFQSSRWTDSLPNQAGALLIIDEVQLKSNPLNTGWFHPAPTKLVGVYPNPATKAVNIRLENAGLYANPGFRLLNALGQTVYVAELSDQLSIIDINGWPAGAYFFLLESGGNVLQSGKLIVE